ncbi:hypothetical protein [Ruegeria jejuensis]|uniref:hypothetical protein n=1 Tax=Ruegeria jejuensis TaxID=3233338 RepID=UPI00355ADCA4
MARWHREGTVSGELKTIAMAVFERPLGLIVGLAVHPELSEPVVLALTGRFGGRATCPCLPKSLVKTAIRVISLVACYVLFQRAYVRA